MLNEELRNVFGSPNLTRMIKWRRMDWEEHVTRVREMRNAYKILVGKPERKRTRKA
jgi:hypothetical protein